MRYVLNGAIDKNGRETDRLARAYAETHHVSYIDALQAVLRHERQSAAKKYAADDERHSVQILGGLISGLPRLSDGSADLDGAVRTINSSPEYLALAREAAGAHLDHLARQLMVGHPIDGVSYQDAFRIAQRDNDAVARLYLGGRATPESIRAILWTKFRYAQERTAVKTYSNSKNHVYTAAGGNEVHCHAFDAI